MPTHEPTPSTRTPDGDSGGAVTSSDGHNGSQGKGTNALEPAGYTQLLETLKQRVRTTQVRAARAANTELLRLYWSIGRDIIERQDHAGWGAKVIVKARVSWRPPTTPPRGRWSPWLPPGSTPTSCVSARSGWRWTPAARPRHLHRGVEADRGQLGINPETLRNWVVQAEIDAGDHPGTSTDDAARLAELEKEVRELRRANEILRRASAFFAAELDRPIR